MAQLDDAETETVALTEETAHHTLDVACEQLDLDPAEAELIRIGSNAVYRLREPVIVRIARDPAAMPSAQRQVAVSRWLEAADYPATRALHGEQPITAAGRPVTFWESASEREEYAPIDQVADLIRRLHQLTPPPSLDLPHQQPFEALSGRLEHLGRIDVRDADFLHERADELHKLYDEVEFALPSGPIHGDANVGNVILDRDGNPLLIDLDSFATGPREWDLVQTALFYERFGWHTEEEYRTFVDVYGFDIMRWPGYRVLADYRELAMTLWLAGKAPADTAAADEVHKRVEAIRANGSRRDWAPF